MKRRNVGEYNHPACQLWRTEYLAISVTNEKKFITTSLSFTVCGCVRLRARAHLLLFTRRLFLVDYYFITRDTKSTRDSAFLQHVCAWGVCECERVCENVVFFHYFL